MNLAKFAIEKRVVSALLTLLILFGGYLAYTLLPRFEDPEFIVRQVKIITPYQGASATEVADEVTDVVENAVQQLQGVKEVKSVSSIGLSEVTLEFTISSTKTRPQLNQKFSQLRAKISDITNQLPPGSSPPIVYDDFGDVYALYFAITGDGYSLAEIKTYAKSLQKELVLVPGVSKVLIAGDPTEVIYVEYNPSKLAQLGFSSGQVAQLLEGQNLVTSAGSVDAGNTRLTIRPSSAVSSLANIEELVIVNAQSGRSFRLKDIATVKRGVKEPESKLLYRDGKPAIGIGISNTIGGNVVNMGDAVNARIAALESQRPLGMQLSVISDQSVSVRTSVNDFVVNVMLALAIVVGTLLIFMGLRSGLLMGGILLVTVAGTLIGMYFYGLNLQRISLGALIIALGMLVDNAIVVVDGTLVRIKKGESPKEASIAVVEQTKWPLLGGTVVGFLAFSAIGFSPDNTGEYAGSLFWTITISLLFSWLIAIWLTPYFCTLFLKAEAASTKVKKEHFILSGYRKILTGFLRFRWVTLGLVLALFAAAVVSFGQVKQGFFPTSTRAQFVIDYTLPQGTTFNKTNSDLNEVSDWVRKLEGVTGTNRVVGGGHLRFMLTYSAESGNAAYGQLLVDVEDYQQITDLLPKIQTHLDSTYPNAISKVWKFVLGPGGGSLIQARFTGKDPVVLRELAEQTKSIYSKQGAISVKDDWREMVKVIRPKINEQNARRVGLSQSDISKAIDEFFNGTTVGLYREADELRSIVFRPNAENRKDVKNIRDIEIFSQSSGRYIPITQVVDDFGVVFENAKLQRYNRSLAIMAEADPAPDVDVSEVFAKIKPEVEALNLPDGYKLEWRGQYGDGNDANAGLASTFPYGFGAMIIVVFLLFNAIKQPIIIYLTVPLAIIGVVFGLIALRTPMEFMAILGMLSLTGMLIKNAIVLIDQTDSEIADGKARMAAVIDAAVSRVRPVSLGVLTTVLGVVPLLSDPFFRSLAVVIICGLSFATILTLIIVPTLYAIFFGVKKDEV
ncbi:efflux RND transporter permease subunit [uncultured Cocleimonas sp.]|uniref:efflux RND transporter permease subunit n=1 Tax=uncultured Cocleimonas sp. TaxID=1051587 RepID=UPI0026066EA2|nr:efflux RND transporter permease subunit [uncultured Cocleimonas sp.]